MSQAQDEIAELMELQREVAARRSKPRKSKKPKESAGDQGPEATGDSNHAAGSESDADDENESSTLEEAMSELSENLEHAVQEIEEAARDQPVLVSLVAFTLGLVVGQLVSRR